MTMKRFLYILSFLIIFSACENDEAPLSYPMNELDGTGWRLAFVERSKYDLSGILIDYKLYDYVNEIWYGYGGNLFYFLGNDAIFHSGRGDDGSSTPEIYIRDKYLFLPEEHKFVMGDKFYELLEYDSTQFIIGHYTFSSGRGEPSRIEYKYTFQRMESVNIKYILEECIRVDGVIETYL